MIGERTGKAMENLDRNSDNKKDLLAEEILENACATPMGQLLKTIASLPEIRQEKVLDVRNRISNGKYDFEKRLDSVLDRVLEELIIK